jgi:uncharacterized protein (TIGR03382 family)
MKAAITLSCDATSIAAAAALPLIVLAVLLQDHTAGIYW